MKDGTINIAGSACSKRGLSEVASKQMAIGNDSRLLKAKSRELLNELKDMGVREDILFDVNVAFEEALRNAMIHGNRQDPAKKVFIRTDIGEDHIEITVSDEGGGFDPDAIPDPTEDDNLLKGSGRGVYLIRHLMDEVRFEQGGCRVVMKKYLSKNPH